MKPKDLTSRLKAEIPDEKLDELCTFLVKNVNRSRGVMASHYDSVRSPDANDIRARNKREPEKMTVPLSYAQVNTLVTFLFLAYTQKESIFELIPTGPEDYGQALTACQAVIDREVRNTNYHSKLVQALLDMARFNIGVMKTSWRFESKEVKRKAETMELPFDLMAGMNSPPRRLMKW
jgi:hypothetical protein